MKRALAAVPVAALALLTGCATPSGGTAAAVNGATVSLDELNKATDDCTTLTTDPRRLVRVQAAQMLLNGLLADAMAKSHKITITPAMENVAVKKLGGSGMPQDSGCGHAIRGTVRLAAVSSALGNAKYAAALKALDVKVNPSVGSYDAASGELAGGSGSLSMEDLGQGQVFGG